VVERLSRTAQNELTNIVTILLGLAVGSTMLADVFLRPLTLAVFALGLAAFAVATASGLLLGKVLYLLSRRTINPLLGAAGVSAVPMAARVVNKVGLEEGPDNYLLMHALGPNVAGVLGSAVAAGVVLSMVPV
jgi:oxaloacetate decarboxylase beta subunit